MLGRAEQGEVGAGGERAYGGIEIVAISQMVLMGVGVGFLVRIRRSRRSCFLFVGNCRVSSSSLRRDDKVESLNSFTSPIS